MVEKAEQIFRDFETDGVPASGKHKPRKREIRAWGRWIEDNVQAGLSNGGLIYDTKANMTADLAHPANASAWVIGDSTVSNNGIYRKSGASGSGSWTKVADLPYSYILASATGSATEITATTSIPVPSASGAALIALPIPVTNSGPITVSFNGGAALTIKTNAGNDVAAGGLVSGMIVAGYVSGSTFRLLSDQASASIVAAAEAAADRAESAAAGVEYPVSYAPQTLSPEQQEQARENIGIAAVISAAAPDRSALKALNTGTATTAFLMEAGREGQYILRDASDYSAEIEAANGQGYFFVSDVDPTKVWAAPLHKEIILTELGADPTAS